MNPLKVTPKGILLIKRLYWVQLLTKVKLCIGDDKNNMPFGAIFFFKKKNALFLSQSAFSNFAPYVLNSASTQQARRPSRRKKKKKSFQAVCESVAVWTEERQRSLHHAVYTWNNATNSWSNGIASVWFVSGFQREPLTNHDTCNLKIFGVQDAVRHLHFYLYWRRQQY